MDEESYITKIGTVYALGIWTVKPGNKAEFIKIWNDFAQWTSMNQKGSQTAILVKDAEASLKFISFGPWQDKNADTLWRSTPEFKKAFVRFRDLCSEIQPHTMRVVASAGE
jgi:heme-degrading monooxygenase HmoA